ncbi:MAG: lactate utilization protein, partial [Acetobacteraceae bacterium]|nr:lactate utilization protein [Acetobacteraceae bacterium]
MTLETEALTGGGFTDRAREAVRDSQLRRNIRKATTTIRGKTAQVTGELPDWEELRHAGQAIKREAMRELARNLEALEANVTRAGGTVHWARDAAEARRIITGLAEQAGARTVVKVKSMT